MSQYLRCGNTLTSSFFIVCLTVWGRCPPALLNDLKKIYVRAVQKTHRIPSGTDKMESMRVAKWDGLGYICKHKILIVMYKFQHSMIANAIYDQFKDRLFQSRDGCSFNHPRLHREIGRVHR